MVSELRLCAYALLGALLLGGLWFFIHHERQIGAQACQLAVAKAQEAEHQRFLAESKRNDALADQLAQAQAARKVTYATITKTVDRIVDRPVYRTECIDDDGLRSINAALAGTPLDPGLAAPAMPAASAASGSDGS